MSVPSRPPGSPADRPPPEGRSSAPRESVGAGVPPLDGPAAPRMTPDEAAHAAVEVAQATHVPLAVPARRTWTSILGMVAGVAVLGGLSAAFVLFPIDWDAIGRWGYLGVGAVVFVATASIALPIPYLLIVARAGTFLDPVGIALVAGAAGMLGELTGYLIGISGSRIVPHGRWYERARGWICTYGFWCIAFFACVPNPFFDAIGLAAGTLRFSWWQFALSCFLGKAVKFFIAAWIGVEALRHGWLD